MTLRKEYWKLIKFDMKHVFVVNSHTTFLTSMGVVSHLGLQVEQVVFVYMRNYKNSVAKVPFQTIDATSLVNSCANISSCYAETISRVDGFVEKNIGAKYNLYVPHLWHYFFQLLYTNPLCRRVSYVQEGGAVQTKVFEKDATFVDRIKMFVRLAILHRRTFECKWYLKGIIYKQVGLDSYAINDSYFGCLPSHNHIVEWPNVNLDISLHPNVPFFVFDGYVNNGLVTSSDYMSLCQEIIEKEVKPLNYVKFHPAQSDEERKQILEYFYSLNGKVEVLSDAIPMEYIIAQIETSTFVGFTSSLLYYAHDFGHNVSCYERLLLQKSESFRAYVKSCGFQTFAETYPNL